MKPNFKSPYKKDHCNFTHFPKNIKEFIKEELSNKMPTDLYAYQTEYIEFESRDGFIADSSNFGGLRLFGFTDLRHFWSTGETVNHKGAQAEIDRQIEFSLDCMVEDLKVEFKDLIEKHKIADNQLNYHDLNDLSESNKEILPLLNAYENRECESMDGDDSSIMFETRFLYHGITEGVHNASISATVNTEGPYHRSHISWSPNTFCEGAKEIEIEWRTEREFRIKFLKALNLVTKEIF